MKTQERENLVLAGLSLAPLFVKVNPYLNAMLTACLTVYVGCYCSVKWSPTSETTSKEHAMRFPLVGSATLLLLFLLIKFLSKDLVNAILTAYLFILGIAALSAMLLSSVKCFDRKELRDMEIVCQAPLIRSMVSALSVDTKSQVMASTPGFFVGMWYDAKKHWLANNVLGICFCIQDGTNQLMGKLWGWKDLYETKLKKICAPWILYTAHEDGNGEYDATASQEEDCDGDHEDCDGSEDNAAAPPEDCNSVQDNGESPSESEDSDGDIPPFGQRRVQLLSVCANFPVACINAYDMHGGQTIYYNTNAEDQVHEQGRMVDLATRLCKPISAYGHFCIDVFPTTTAAGAESSAPITGQWSCSDDKLVAHTYTICGGPSRKVEITYFVIDNTTDVQVQVKLKLKDLSCRSRAVYGTIKARACDYGNKSVHLFSCERGSSLSVPPGSSSIVLLEPSLIGLPYRRQLELYIDVDLTVITISDNHDEDKILKFTDLKFTHEIWSQEREVDDYQVKVGIFCNPYF